MRDNKRTAVNLVPDYHDLRAKRVFLSGSAMEQTLLENRKLLNLLLRLELHLRIAPST
jgi:hypothetical protein